jgi:hypothetical protein
MSLLTLRPFLGIDFVVLDSWCSYLGPATKSFKGGDCAFQSKRDGEGVGIIAKRS